MSFNNVSCTFSHFKALFSLSQFQQKETIALKKRSEKREIICNFITSRLQQLIVVTCTQCVCINGDR